MKLLKDILYGVRITAVSGPTDVQISEIHFDSRKLGKNDVFVAIRGTVSDGHQYIDTAVNSGVAAVICEEFPENLSGEITFVAVQNTKKALAIMASNYYDTPSRNLKLIGVTGTNGKTTISTLLYQLFKKAGFKVGLISTIRIMVDDEEHPTKLTTPDAITINQHLHMMNAAGVEFCFMEVSSHGIDQYRIEGLVFTGAIFTNLSHDHLDYHKTFKAYRDTKKRLFDDLPRRALL